MFFKDRNESRSYFFNVWEKQKNKQPLETIEVLILDVILKHPEYHSYLNSKKSIEDASIDDNYGNPFLHMSMHIALQEQINSNRPSGITRIFNELISQSGSTHNAEHKMMECLKKIIDETNFDIILRPGPFEDYRNPNGNIIEINSIVWDGHRGRFGTVVEPWDRGQIPQNQVFVQYVNLGNLHDNYTDTQYYNLLYVVTVGSRLLCYVIRYLWHLWRY